MDVIGSPGVDQSAEAVADEVNPLRIVWPQGGGQIFPQGITLALRVQRRGGERFSRHRRPIPGHDVWRAGAEHKFYVIGYFQRPDGGTVIPAMRNDNRALAWIQANASDETAVGEHFEMSGIRGYGRLARGGQ